MEKDNLIFIHKLLKAIADSIIKVFIPLYILKMSNDLTLSMIYLTIYSSSVMFFMFTFKKIIEKWGVIAIFLHFIPIIATEAVFTFWDINIYSVIIAAILMSMSQALYSVPLNIAFAFGDKKSNVAKFQIATNIGKLLFTLISGFILSSELEHSFLILSVSSSVFYITSVIPLLFIYKLLTEHYASFEKGGKKAIKINKWFTIFHISFGIFQPVMDNLVPLYLYINNLSFASVTTVIAVVELLKIAINFISQIFVKHKKDLYLVITGAIFFMSSILVMLFVKIPVVLYIFSCLASVSFPLTFVPMFRMYSQYTQANDVVFNGMLKRDYDIFVGRPALYALSFVGLGLIPSMIVGVVSVPMMLVSEIKLIKDNQNGSL